jgi:hypothetical protein
VVDLRPLTRFALTQTPACRTNYGFAVVDQFRHLSQVWAISCGTRTKISSFLFPAVRSNPRAHLKCFHTVHYLGSPVRSYFAGHSSGYRGMANSVQ